MVEGMRAKETLSFVAERRRETPTPFRTPACYGALEGRSRKGRLGSVMDPDQPVGLDACGVEAAIDEGDFAGYAGGESAREEKSGVSDFPLLDVAVKGGSFSDAVEDGIEVADAAGGEGLDGTGGDSIDADLFGAEFEGEITDEGFKRGFSNTHDVVVGEDLFGAVIGESEKRTALGHKRKGGAGYRDERVDADVVSYSEIPTGGFEDGVFDVGSEADGMDDGVNRRKGYLDIGKGGVDLGILGDIALDEEAAAGLAEVGKELFGFALEAFGLVAEDEGGAGFGEGFGDGVGDGSLVGDAEDDGDLALHIDHDGVRLLEC